MPYIPELILLKTNQKYLEFQTFKERVNGFEGSKAEEVFKEIIRTEKSFYPTEFEFEFFERGITYWDSSLVPIIIEGKAKYIIETVTEVTDKVLASKKFEDQSVIIKPQNEFMRMQTILLDQSNEAIFARNLNGTILYWNKGAEMMYGYSREEAVGLNTQDLLKPVYPNNIDNKKLTFILENARVWKDEVEHICKDGRKLIVETYQQVILDDLGQMIVLETNKDKTLNKVLEEQLLLKNTQLESIIENITDGLTVSDRNGNFIMMNSSAKKIFQQLNNLKKAGEITKDNIFTNLDGTPVAYDDMPLNRALRGDIVKNLRLKMKQANLDEQIIEVTAVPIFQNNELSMAVTSTHDITELIETQKQLESQKMLLESIVEHEHDALVVFDKAGNAIMVNAEARKIYPHYNRETTVTVVHNGYQCFDLDNNLIPVENLPTRRAFRGEKVRNEKILIKHPDWSRYTEVNATPIFNNENNLELVVVSHHNITDTIKNQQEIRSQQEQIIIMERARNNELIKSMEMKDEFLSLITHELKTPLAVITSAIQVMEIVCASELSKKAKDYLNKIQQNTNRLLKLVDNILDNTRLLSGHFKVNTKDLDIILLTKTICEGTKIYAEQKGIKLSFSSTLSEKVISIDEEHYEKIILNLLSNAIKFTPTGKSIFVKVSQKTAKGKVNVCIEVKDEGIGIPSEKKDIIFERFGQVDYSFSRKAEGTGLGLSIVKMLVEMHNGVITLNSEVGIGSTFTIMLPATKVKEAEDTKVLTDISKDRLNNRTNIEFSDVY